MRQTVAPKWATAWRKRPEAASASAAMAELIHVCLVEHMYQYFLDSFVPFLYNDIVLTEHS